MMICGRYFFRDMKNAVPAFRFRFSLVDDALKLLVESCRNTADFVTPVLIVPYVTDVSTENSLALAAPSMCRRTPISQKACISALVLASAHYSSNALILAISSFTEIAAFST